MTDNIANKLKNVYSLFIGGEWKPASDGSLYTSINPANGEALAQCAEATREDVDLAIKAAWKAYPAWKKVEKNEKAAILEKIADRIEENKEWLARVESMDNGKPIRETLAVDIPHSVNHFRYFASLIRTDEGTASIVPGNLMSLVLREPLGVVAQIVPWNFPFLMAAWKIAPALASGNCIVFKPSSETSLSVLEFARIIEDLLPAGVFNVITGAGSKSGQYILEHSDISKLAFTGSTEIGKTIAKAAAEKLIPSTLELGGKSANIVFDDCDEERALEGVQLGILFNQGQVCCAGSRVFVQEKIYDDFVAKLVNLFKKVRIGDPLNPETQMGAQISKKHAAKIISCIESAKKEGAVVAVGGDYYTENGCDKGSFIQPTLLVNVENTMNVAQEEIFGPVAVVIKFKTEDEVIAMANDSQYGLGGAVWTKDINRALKVARNIETGRMWVNTYNQIPEGAPFGGYKKSGIGRENDKSVLDAYSQKKNIMINLNETPYGLYN